jgi:hypothetical protein
MMIVLRKKGGGGRCGLAGSGSKGKEPFKLIRRTSKTNQNE